MSVVVQGWGTAFAPLLQGYGAAAALPTLREVFRVPLPDGSAATRQAPTGQPPYVGAQEAGIAFGLDFAGWLAAPEALARPAQVSCWAYPEQGGAAPYDATAAVVQSSAAVGTTVVVTLHQATAQTDYVVTVAAQTTTGRVLECRMPRLWCPD